MQSHLTLRYQPWLLVPYYNNKCRSQILLDEDFCRAELFFNTKCKMWISQLAFVIVFGQSTVYLLQFLILKTEVLKF